MTGTDVAARRAALRERLIDAAERHVAADGAGTLQARPLAADAGCAVGTIYTIFDDLAGLMLSVNARTAERLNDAMAAAAATGGDARARLGAAARAYLAFAAENRNLWRSLFAPELPGTDDPPEWYARELEALVEHVRAPLRSIAADDRARRLGETVFSAIHGVVELGLDRRYLARERQELDAMIGELLDLVFGKQSIS